VDISKCKFKVAKRRARKVY